MDAKAALVPVMNAPDDLRKGLKTAIQRRCGREQPLTSNDVCDRDAGFPPEHLHHKVLLMRSRLTTLGAGG
jgi:hypothetical protein